MTNQKAPTTFTNADFFAIKRDLVTYLSTRTEFKDFNFEGSAINILLDALAYTANYQAVHSNMALSEVFLDSCQLRSSAASIAKELGYFPRQVTSSKAFVKLVYEHPTDVSGAEIFLREGARFSSRTTRGDRAFEFVTTKPFKFAEPVTELGEVVEAGRYEVDVEISEGSIVGQTFTFPDSFISALPIFEILDDGVDTDYIKVTVTPIGMDPEIYTVSTDIVDLNGSSRVFFLQESIEGKVQFYFGDGILGRTPEPGSAISVSYLKTNGKDANGSQTFELDSESVYQVSPIVVDPIPVEDVQVIQQGRSGFGADQQSLESIKFTAPRAYSAQNRMVTAADYQALLLREFGFIETMSVWGGEHNNPPAFGRVFVSIKPVNGTVLSPGVKASVLENVLKKYSVVGIIPELVDPDYTFVNIRSDIEYDRSKSIETESQLTETVRTSVETFFRTTVSKFDSVFRFSNLCAAIDDSHPAILGSVNSLLMVKKFVPIPFTELVRTFDFGNSIVKGSVQVGPLKTVSGDTVTLKDENGSLNSYLNGQLRLRDVGSVDYNRGVVSITRFSFPIASNTEISCFAKPGTQDIYSLRNNLIVLDSSDIRFKPFYRVDKLDATNYQDRR